jgi:hypothetical protein
MWTVRGVEIITEIGVTLSSINILQSENCVNLLFRAESVPQIKSPSRKLQRLMQAQDSYYLEPVLHD